MANTRQTKLDEFLEINGGYQIADMDLMPILQTDKEKEEGVPQKYVPRTGIIQFNGVGRFRQGFKHSESCVWDNNNKVLYAAVIGNHANGSPRFRRIHIDDAAFLDLSRPVDRENYYILIHSTLMQDGPRSMGQPKFKKIDKEGEANAYLAKRKDVRTASEIVDEMGGDQMRKFAMLFGISDKSSDAIIKQQLYEKAEKDSATLIKRWNASDRELWQLVKKANAEYVFTQRDNQYFFGNLPMGINEEMCVEKLKAKPELCEAINDAIVMKSGVKKEVVKAKTPFGKKAETA